MSLFLTAADLRALTGPNRLAWPAGLEEARAIPDNVHLLHPSTAAATWDKDNQPATDDRTDMRSPRLADGS